MAAGNLEMQHSSSVAAETPKSVLFCKFNTTSALKVEAFLLHPCELPFEEPFSKTSSLQVHEKGSSPGGAQKANGQAESSYFISVLQNRVPGISRQPAHPAV